MKFPLDIADLFGCFTFYTIKATCGSMALSEADVIWFILLIKTARRMVIVRILSVSHARVSENFSRSFRLKP